MDRGIKSECISYPASNSTQKIQYVLRESIHWLALAQGAWCARCVVVRRRARENVPVHLSALSIATPPPVPAGNRERGVVDLATMSPEEANKACRGTASGAAALLLLLLLLRLVTRFVGVGPRIR